MNTQRHQPWRAALIAAAARKAKAAACKDCGAPILTGLDGDNCAFSVAADIDALSWAGELGAAYTQGRRTFEHAAHELWWRSDMQRQQPARDPVHAEHRCRDPIPAAWLSTTPDPLRKVTDSDKPSF